MRCDAVVIGGGPAGLAAATWLARYRRSVVALDSGEYRNRWVDEVHGYLGLDPLSPGDLLERARQELARYPTAEIETSRTESVSAEDGGFVVVAQSRRIQARALVLATGVEDEFPDIPGFFDHYGADVVHCPACDGYEARDRVVAAIGWDEHVTGFALSLLNWARTVTVVTEGRQFEGDAECRRELAEARIEVLEEAVRGFQGSRGSLRGLELEGGHTVACDLAFFSIAHRPRNELARALGCALTDEGCVVVDAQGRTSVNGVYAAGDLTPGNQLVQVAAAKGTAAGIACAQWLGEAFDEEGSRDA